MSYYFDSVFLADIIFVRSVLTAHLYHALYFIRVDDYKVNQLKSLIGRLSIKLLAYLYLLLEIWSLRILIYPLREMR